MNIEEQNGGEVVVASISCPLGGKILAARGQPEQIRGLGLDAERTSE